ncbi:MAG: hypothetical protein ABW135_08910 [Thermoleophilaceae bacterium]
MTQENVRVVGAAYESLASSGLEAFSDHWADEIEWQTMRGHWRCRQAGSAYIEVRDRKITPAREYATCAEALEAVGLRG